MKTALLLIAVAVLLALLLASVMRGRYSSGSRMTDRQYFAAARQRAIAFRLAARGTRGAE